MNKNINYKLSEQTLAYIKNQSEYIKKTIEQFNGDFKFIKQRIENNVEPKIDIASIVSRNNNRNIDVQVDIEYFCRNCKKRVKF